MKHDLFRKPVSTPDQVRASFFRKMLCAGHVAGKLSDRANRFFTLNECAAFVELGHGSGVHAPGLELPLTP